jgi:hypothetical protein
VGSDAAVCHGEVGQRVRRAANGIEITLAMASSARRCFTALLDGDAREAGSPTTVGRLPATPAAATRSGSSLLFAADDGSVFASADRGRTWQRRLLAAVD